MDATVVQPAELKKIVHEVIGSVASDMLLGRVNAILDEASKDAAKQQEACTRIEKMVCLFISPETGRSLQQRFRAKLA